jgi:hypothetical protein
MRKQLLQVIIISFVFLSMPIIHSAEEEKDRLLVIPLKAKGGINQDEVTLLTDILSVEIHKSGKFTILNREDMQAVLNEKEFELAMGCEDNVCLLENVAKLAVNKIIAGNIGKLGQKYIISIRMINEDGENEMMEKETCACEIDELDKTIEQVAYKFLKYMRGYVAQDGLIRVESEPRGARIYLDGDNIGTTPDSIRRIVPGTHKVEVKMNGYKDWSKMVDVVAGEEGFLTAKLEQTEVSKASLRSSFRRLSVSQVQSMPNISIRKKHDYGFHGHSTINHRYDLEFISGDKVVLDSATGLMWHQNGSDEYMKWNKVKDWIGSLNSRGYAGYHDWRLPTLEEAASLLESREKNGVFIDSVFSNKQEWIWTGDEYGSDDAWDVRFNLGDVYRRNIASVSSVRPVRSGN